MESWMHHTHPNDKSFSYLLDYVHTYIQAEQLAAHVIWITFKNFVIRIYYQQLSRIVCGYNFRWILISYINKVNIN